VAAAGFSNWCKGRFKLVPKTSFYLTSGRKMRALGATISGMRHRWILRIEPDGQNSVISFVISKWLLPEISFSDASQEERGPGNEIESVSDRMRML